MDTPTYLVLGATGGIGSELSRSLVRSGFRVALAARDGDRLTTLAEEISATTFAIDATGFDAVEQAARSVMEHHGRLDGIANCVGSLMLKPAHLTSSDDWRATIDANLGSAFATVRAAGKVMKGGGSVVLVSSAAARLGLANHEAIAAAKAGVLGLTLSAAATYGSRNLRFNAVAPGLVRTPMTARLTANETAVRSSEAMHALGRLGEAGDVARMIAWLLHPDQTWVTGQVFGVDGGLATVRTRGA